MKNAASLILILLWGALASPMRADERSPLSFDLRLLGLRAGIVEIAASISDTAYAARSRFRSAGLLSILRSVHADVTVRGLVRGGRLQPQEYTEAIDDGRRTTNVEVRFYPGLPRLLSGDPGSSAPPADTSRLRHALDPLTVLYLALRDQDPEQLCRIEADVFDGHRHARFVLNQRQDTDEAVTCNGSYRRIAGYGEGERESRIVPISVTYVRTGQIMRAERVAFDTRLGPAVMQRR